MERTCLFVTPEESGEVRALGAQWDDRAKCWYIDRSQASAAFSKWLPREVDSEFNVVSDRAFVAAANAVCQQCEADIEVICIYCDSGTASGEPLTRFTVSHVSAMDEELARQMTAWPQFRRREQGSYSNCCAQCGKWQDDLWIHTEPGDVFFDIPAAPAVAIRLATLSGTVRLSGDEHFQVD